jgi:SAM-dependent methyltransferase
MPTAGELLYYQAIGESGAVHAVNKPLSDPDGDLMLMQVGAVLSVLPPAPARILECGCGTGWLSRFFAARGYDATGIDVCPDAIELAQRAPNPFGFAEGAAPPGAALRFLVEDAEAMSFREEFDAVVFFDALHHALDEGLALRRAYRALRPGGVCITSEPGWGHAAASREAVAKYGVTEKDMPTRHIIRLGRAAGFQRAERFPRMDHLGRFFLREPSPRHRVKRLVRCFWPLHLLNLVRTILKARFYHDAALVVLHKPETA